MSNVAHRQTSILCAFMHTIFLLKNPKNKHIEHIYFPSLLLRQGEADLLLTGLETQKGQEYCSEPHGKSPRKRCLNPMLLTPVCTQFTNFTPPHAPIFVFLKRMKVPPI